jgi:hypothetical protein
MHVNDSLRNSFNASSTLDGKFAPIYIYIHNQEEMEQKVHTMYG